MEGMAELLTDIKRQGIESLLTGNNLIQQLCISLRELGKITEGTLHTRQRTNISRLETIKDLM